MSTVDGRVDKKKSVEIAIVNALREKEYSLNTVNNYGENLFHISAANGCIEILEEILSKNKDCNVDRKNKFGWTPLMQAIRNGNIDTVKLLLQNGSNVNESTYLGMSALGLAAAINEEMFDAVYKACPSALEHTVNDDITPLCIAAMKNDKRLFFKLIDLDLDVSKANEYTHLMMRQSTISEIASLARPHLDIEDYWNDCSDNIEIDEGLHRKKKIKRSWLSNAVNEINFESVLQVNCDNMSDKKCQPKVYIGQIIRSDKTEMKTLKENRKPSKLNLLDIQHFQYDQKSLISPNLMYNRDEGLPNSPNMYFSQDECCLDIEETKGSGNESSNQNELICTDSSMSSTLKSSLHRLQSIRPADIKIVEPDVTLSFSPEFSPNRSPNVPIDVNNEDSVYYDTTPTPPHYKTPPRGMVLNSQQAKLIVLLKRFGLGKHISTFLEQEVDIELFFTLNEMDLKEIGIERKSNRKAILKVIENCKKNETLSGTNIFF